MGSASPLAAVHRLFSTDCRLQASTRESAWLLCVILRVRVKTGGLLTGGVCVSVPLLASRLRMLLSDICRRAAMGGTLESVAGSRVTSAFMSLSSSSNWFNTAMTTTNAQKTIDKGDASILTHGFTISSFTCFFHCSN